MSEKQMDFWENISGWMARHDWISACQFHSLSESEIFQEIFRRVSQVYRPLVLLDLDSTLYEVGPRTQKILQEWVESSESLPFPRVRNTLAKLDPSQIGFSIVDTFQNLKLDPEGDEVKPALEIAKRYWFKRFFTDAYLPYDRPYPRAAHFTQRLKDLGAEIVYLTGRDEPNMGQGTRANLLRDGFAWEPQKTHLLMKPYFQMADLEYKKSASEFLRTRGTLIASFENEPLNLVALHELFPDAMHVFVNTVCSLNAAKPRKGLYRIDRFEWN